MSVAELIRKGLSLTSSPSPRPSPSGRGGIEFRWSKSQCAGFAGGLLKSLDAWARCSLSPRERVRGNGALSVIAALTVSVSILPSVEAAETISIVPQKIALHGPEARQLLVVEKFQDKLFTGQLTNGITFVSSRPDVVKIEEGVAIPVANGAATITAKSGKQTARADVVVTAVDKPFEWSFRNNVQPVLAKAGCSSGPCHGAQAGQNGFKLSLRGYDDDSDWVVLTHQAFGRRVNYQEPGKSMILTKPTTAIPHKGGKRFETNSIDYRILAEWIASGTPGPKTNDARLDRLEIIPDHVILKTGDSQQLLVRAYFNDGHTEDVTHWAKFTSANGTVATIDDNGVVKVVGNGEGAITAWCLQKIALGSVTVPFTNKVSSSAFAKAKKRNFIDELVIEKLKEVNVPPSPQCSDAEFIRRAFIDTIGVLPTIEETRKFVADKSSKKRDALIEELLRRPEFVDYWSHKWSDLFLVNSKLVSQVQRLKQNAMWSYYNWIRKNVEANTPWDKIATSIMLAEGSTLENGAGNFFILHDNPKDCAENVSLAFLGMSVQCAKCHNHPMEKWTNDEYYQFANLFARVRAKNGPGGDGDNIIFASMDGDLVQPRTGKPQVPKPLEGKPVPINSTEDRRKAVAEWLTAPENPYFAKAIVNRVWANFYGVGLVEAVDDVRITNPASNDKLFRAAAKYLIDQKYDLKALMRAILQSETYQRSSVPLPENSGDSRFYSRYYPRRFMAEVLLDTVSQVTDVPTKFKGEQERGGPAAINYPAGLRALQLPDSNIDSYFLKVFGLPDREKTCECERTSEPNVTQVLHIANGDTLNKKLQAKDNRISKWLEKKVSNEQIVDEAYLIALSRPPTAVEKQKLLKTLNAVKPEELRPALEDMLWAILSSKEFLFNH